MFVLTCIRVASNLGLDTDGEQIQGVTVLTSRIRRMALGLALAACASVSAAKADDPGALGVSPISHVPGSISILGGIGVGDSNLSDLMIDHGNIETDEVGKSGLVGAAMSRQLVRFWEYFWLEAEVGAGLRFEPDRDYYSPEAWGAIYLRFDGFPWNDVLRTSIGISTGLDVVADLPPSETNYGQKSVPGGAVLQHYLSPEIAFSLPDNPEDELFIRIHHRSTGYGLFWDASTGSNLVAIGLRFRR